MPRNSAVSGVHFSRPVLQQHCDIPMLRRPCFVPHHEISRFAMHIMMSTGYRTIDLTSTLYSLIMVGRLWLIINHTQRVLYPGCVQLCCFFLTFTNPNLDYASFCPQYTLELPCDWFGYYLCDLHTLHACGWVYFICQLCVPFLIQFPLPPTRTYLELEPLANLHVYPFDIIRQIWIKKERIYFYRR